MKKLIFTTFLLLFFGAGITLFAQSPEGSTGWETLMPGEPLLLEEDFRDFPFHHSDQDPNMGSSVNTDTVHPGYKDTTAFRRCIGSIDTIFYDFYQCAFVPNWLAAYAYKDSVDLVSPDAMTAQVTRGFVEIAREREADFTVNGYFIVDLRKVEFVEAVQWAHSSCGGNKRGFTLAKSVDNGETWDTVRMQTGNTSTSMPQPNTFNCQNSAYAMRWEDGIYESNVMLRFTQAAGQAVRIHDLKIYGTADPAIGINDYANKEIGITWHNNILILSEIADIGIYNMNGILLKRSDQVETFSTSDLPQGVYIVRAKTGAKITTTRIVIN